MNKEQFYNIISDTKILLNTNETSIDEIITEFPYFQTAYIAKSKILSDKESFKYDNFIKIASLYSVDRSKLFNYLSKKEEITNETKDKVVIEAINTNIVSHLEKELEIESTLKQENEISEQINSTENKELELPIKIEETTNTESDIVINETIETELNLEIKQETKELILHDKIEEKTLKPEETIADKILKSLENAPWQNKTESIADIILRKAAEAKKQRETTQKQDVAEPENVQIKPKIEVEIKKFEPVVIKKQEPIIANLQPKTENISKKTDEITEITKKTDDVSIEIKNTLKITNSSYFENEIAKKQTKEITEFTEMSFNEWLNFVESPLKNQEKNTTENNNQISLIDKFISNEKNIRIRANQYTPTNTDYFVKKSETEKDDFITETLANIYIKQKLYDKAIKAFVKLSLKYPEKNTYFASQIKKIEKLINKQ